MAVGYQTGSIWTEWGTPNFVHALFSNVAYHLEEGRWGTKFPYLMNELYAGRLPAGSVPGALTELRQIMKGFAAIPPEAVIWDIDDLSKQPPWGSNIAATITDLSNYFVTSTGRDLLADFDEGLEYAEGKGLSVELVGSPIKEK